MLNQSRRARERSQYHQPRQQQSTGGLSSRRVLRAEMETMGQKGEVRNTTDGQRNGEQRERAETERGAGCEFPGGNDRDMLGCHLLQWGGLAEELWLRTLTRGC